MADDIQYSGTGASPPANIKQVTDEHVPTGAHMPVVKIAVSTDGSKDLVPSDANGLLVRTSATPPLPTGAATEAKQDTQVTAEQAILATLGTTSGAAVITDANGALQQYLRGIVKLLITSGTVVLGAGTAAIGKLAANSGVDIGDVDVTSIVMPNVSSAIHTNVAGSASSGQFLAANVARIGVSIWNDSAATLYIKYGTTATATDCKLGIPPNGFWEMGALYRGRIDGIWSAATGAARITEM